MGMRGLTHRERVSRKRVLQALKTIRGQRLKGFKGREAVIRSIEINQRARFGIAGKPFLELPEKRVMKSLDRAALPGRVTAVKRRVIKALRKTFVRRKYYEKYYLIRDLFKQGPELGIIMVKPELYSEWGKIVGYLRTIGCNPVFSKNFIFTKDDIQRLYPHALADRERYYHFVVGVTNLLTSPGRVIVFEHLPVEKYKEILPTTTTENHPQNLFNAVFKSLLRKEFTLNTFRELGFPKEKTVAITGLAKTLDVYGFFEASIPKGFDPMLTMNGVHIPDYGEIPRDARTLLNLSELMRIEKKLKIRPSNEALRFRR